MAASCRVASAECRIDPMVYDFIKQQEGYNPRAYWDHKQWSIGHGTRASGPGETIDEAEADRRLRFEVDKAGGYVDQHFPGLDPHRRDALTSFTYNLGPGWMTSPSRLAAAVKAGDWDAAARIMPEYSNASGKWNKGLFDRRQRESAMLLGGPSESPPMALGGPKPGSRPMPYLDTPYAGMSPDEVQRLRDRATEQRRFAMRGDVAPNAFGVLAALAGGIGSQMDERSSRQGERSGQQAASQALISALQGGDRNAAISGMLNNPWTRDIGSKLALNEFASQSPSADLERRIKEAQLKAAERKDAPTFGKIGPDQFGQDQYGWIDPTTQTVKPANPTASTGLPGETPLPLPTGEEFLKTLPQPIADQVKGIADGRIAFPGGFALKSPYWQRMVTLVSQYDPNFDAVNYNARNKTRSDFTSGKSAQNITAFNTAIQHLDTLYNSIDGLENSGFRVWNKIANPIRENADPKYAAAMQKFQTARTAVADELTRAFRGMGGNVHDIIQWEKNINSADSPEALRASISQAIELLNGRLESVADQYNRGMGTTKQPIELLSPKAQEAVRKMHEGARSKAASAPATSGSPPPGQYAWNPKTGKVEPVGASAATPTPADVDGASRPEAPAGVAELGSKENPFPTYKDAQRGKYFMHQGIKLYLDPNLGPVRAPE